MSSLKQFIAVTVVALAAFVPFAAQATSYYYPGNYNPTQYCGGWAYNCGYNYQQPQYPQQQTTQYYFNYPSNYNPYTQSYGYQVYNYYPYQQQQYYYQQPQYQQPQYQQYQYNYGYNYGSTYNMGYTCPPGFYLSGATCYSW